ncbi:hypothetical protein DICVIV_06014 [Dictyocaulus viviparus]|uniref:Major facilitator superfamily (MFS) profile domain-containing protein n=1 Tax=Dictyocaulus viviparus TaxID=29172 RepID=A0A0D8XZX0_DICVI|nr:hypothetical protein DICVIV_06014 [Dictyocaulus viviparus]
MRWIAVQGGEHDTLKASASMSSSGRMDGSLEIKMELKKLKEAKKLTKVATKYPTITLNGVPEFNPLSNNDYVIEEKTNWNAVMMAGIVTFLSAVENTVVGMSEWPYMHTEKTNWNAVMMAGIVTFLSAVENTVVGMSEWPYMHTIDPEATSQFFGLVSSVSKFGHAIFAVIFAFWAYKAQSIKMPLIVGRVIAFFACCLYLCIELLPEGRRYLMLLCYFLFGIASSSSTVLRAYIVAVSTAHDRAKAFSAFIVANMLSIVVGPGQRPAADCNIQSKPFIRSCRHLDDTLPAKFVTKSENDVCHPPKMRTFDLPTFNSTILTALRYVLGNKCKEKSWDSDVMKEIITTDEREKILE